MDKYNSRKNWHLLDENEDTVQVGDLRETFRGETVRISYMQPPHKVSSSGKVTVEFVDEADRHGTFYPSVIGCKFIHCEPASLMCNQEEF